MLRLFQGPGESLDSEVGVASLEPLQACGHPVLSELLEQQSWFGVCVCVCFKI